MANFFENTSFMATGTQESTAGSINHLWFQSLMSQVPINNWVNDYLK